MGNIAEEMKPRKYRKKPVIVEAIQATQPGLIKTLEGKMAVNVGDWIVTGIKGERYPVKDEIFRATYEPAAGEGEQGLTEPESCGKQDVMGQVD